MLTRIRQWLAPPVFESDEEKNRVVGLANIIILAIIFTESIALLFAAVISRSFAIMGVTTISMLLPSVAAFFLLRRGHERAAALLITSTLWLVLVAMGFLFGGVTNSSLATIVLIIIIAALLLGGRAAVIFAGLSCLTVTLTFISEVIGILPPPLIVSQPITFWMVHSIDYGIAATLMYLAMGNLTTAIRRAQRLAAGSNAQRDQLQVLLNERTQDLERNVNYLRATTALGRESAVVMGDPQQLLLRTVAVISEQFGFYHTGIYLINPSGEWAELRAASGQGGQQLIARGHRMRVGEEGMVGYVAQHGEYRLALDVSQDAEYRPLAELPDTRSELVLPLRVRDEIIGVLDVQSAEARAYNDQDIQTLQVLADQVALAISNARLFAQAQQVAEVERRAYGELTRQAWRSLLQTGRALGFYSNAETTVPAGDLWQPEMKRALQTGSTTRDEGDAQRLAVPVKVRDEVIGVIDFSKPAKGNAWTAEEIALSESLTEQLSTALESARLYQDTRRRAARERILREISDQMQRATDMEALMRITAEELNKALGASRTYVHLGTEALLSSNGDEPPGEGGD
jgi:GAF domain-containing protein